MEQINSFIELLREARDLSALPIDHILILESEFISYIDKLKICDSFDAAEKVLIELGVFQEKLAELSFRYNVPLSENLNNFIRDYDRSDEPTVREQFYKNWAT